MQPLVHISKLVPTAQNPSLFKVTDSRDAQDPEAGDGSFVERRHPYVETLPHEPSAPATLQTELAEATAIRNNSIHNGSPSPPSYESVNASPEDWSHDLLLKALLALIQQDTDISRYLLKEDGTIETSVAPAMHPLPAFLISFGTSYSEGDFSFTPSNPATGPSSAWQGNLADLGGAYDNARFEDLGHDTFAHLSGFRACTGDGLL